MTVRRFVALLSFLSLLAPGVSAQERPAYSESVEVRIGNVDVVVTTKDGRHVGGLQPQDFELYENGKLQKITNFYEARPDETVAVPPAAAPAAAAAMLSPAPQPAAVRRKVIVFFVDAYSLHPHVRNEVLKVMRQFADENLREGDLVMLAVWNHQLKIPLTITTDRAALAREIDKLSKATSQGLAEDEKIVEMLVRSAAQEAEVASGPRPGAMTFQQAYGVALGHVRDYAGAERKLVLNMTQDLEGLFRGISGIEGKKIVVLIGEHFPQQPGLPLYQFANDTFQRYNVQVAAPQLMTGGMNLSQLPEEIARVANENDVTLHCIYSGQGGGTTPAEMQSADERTSVREFLEFSDTGSTFSTVTRETGGVALLGSKNFELAAKTLSEDLSRYYSLAYRLDPAIAGERHITVKVKDPSYVVRTRKSIIGKSLDEENASKVTSTLLQESAKLSPELHVSVGKPRGGRNKITVPIDVSFPSSLLTLIPQDGKSVGGFEVLIAASDDFHRLSAVERQRQDVSWPEGQVPPMVTFHFESVVRNRPGSFAIGVVDRWSRTTWQTRVDVPR